MNLTLVKQELIKRYKYLYENAYFILAPYMYEETEEEHQEFIKKYGNIVSNELSIYLNIPRLNDINRLFEEFLLSDNPLEESKLYKTIESNRDNKEYLEKVKQGMLLKEKDKKRKNYIIRDLDIWEILARTYDFVNEQSGDLKNKENKLYILDQYIRISRYRNNGRIYTSGRNPDLHDYSSISVPMHKLKPSRNIKDVGITKNKFITTIRNAPYYQKNLSIFSENEKQEIYLLYHDELPCNLEIECQLEEEYIKTMIETRLNRPTNTNPCRETFIIKEEDIFTNPKDILYRYYQICPHCGYIVNIPKEILSDGIKERIEKRCQEDPLLFRKMYLYSELFSLDKQATKNQRKVLKNNHN